MKILTFDIEEWFHLLDNDSTRSEEQWSRYEKRIEGNVGRILDILDSTNTKATFFIIGWIAKTYPELVKRIAERYEIGSHTMNHQLVWQQSRKQFREDVTASVKLLEDISGKKVTAFRAPGFSIRESEGWAFEILHDAGITTDCSVFPAHHSHGGMPSYSAAGPAIIQYQGVEMKEFPITFHKFAGKNIIYTGGGYFRLCPYRLLKRWTAQQGDYLMSYIHPRDLDPGQPMIKELSRLRRFKSYHGIKTAERKLRQWLTDFDFTDIQTASQNIDWNSVPRVQISHD